MEFWHVAIFANSVVAVAYLAISITILGGVQRSGQWRSNPLAVTTGAIFLTCAAGHGAHVEHMLLPSSADAAREVWDWHLTAIDLTTAVIGVRYWMLRGRFGALLRGTMLFEDVAARRQEAYDIQDGVVQQLATAKMAFELGDSSRGMRSLEGALASSRGLMADRHEMSADRDAGARPGDLRRRGSATP